MKKLKPKLTNNNNNFIINQLNNFQFIQDNKEKFQNITIIYIYFK